MAKGSGGKFETKVKNLLDREIPNTRSIKRGSNAKKKILHKIQKEPDFWIVSKKSKKPLIAIECKYTSKGNHPARYWTLASRGYTILNDIKLRYPKIKCFLVFNKNNEDDFDYYALFKKARLKFVSLKSDVKKFVKEIKR